MATTREIKRHIRSVRNIGQVTRAMQMVAASKMRRAQEQVLSTRPYAQKSWELLTHLAAVSTRTEEETHPLLQVRPLQTIGLVVITSDRGLAGGYNQNLLRHVLQFLKGAGNPVRVITVGRKGRDFLLRLGVDLVADFTGLPALPSQLDVLPIARTVLDDYMAGEYDEVVVAYTNFINTLRQEPEIRKLLPIPPVVEAESTQLITEISTAPPPSIPEYIYEPSAKELLNQILPRFTELQLYHAILESVASEHSARMVAMRNATDNAKDLEEHLTLTFNRARQASITREMLDIAGGAEALTSAGRAGL